MKGGVYRMLTQNDASKHKTAEYGQCKTVQDIIDRSPGILGESPECT